MDLVLGLNEEFRKKRKFQLLINDTGLDAERKFPKGYSAEVTPDPCRLMQFLLNQAIARTPI